jgi:uroporphyrin-III C-methyltransferase
MSDVKSPGAVYLVGAGPGDPELLTLKARRLIDEADIIFFDALVNEEILRGTAAQLVFVGKRKGFKVASQAEINRSLFEAANRGLRVVRLKGGDPLVFGRGGEEIVFLRERGIPIEVVPGISAAFAAAAAGEVPLTHRGVAGGVVFATAQSSDGAERPLDTLVYYMGAASTERVAREALASGRSPDTPVALICDASLPSETIWIKSLGDVARNSTEYPAPLLVIIGEVVRLGALGTGEMKRRPETAAVQSKLRAEAPWQI